MGFGIEEKIRFCSVSKDAKIAIKEDGESRFFDYVEGHLETLSVREVVFGGEPVEMLAVHLRDEDGPLQVGTALHGSHGRSIILCLAGAPRRGLLRIRPDKNKAGYNAVVVTLDGNKLQWAEPLAELEAGPANEPDDSHRREQIHRLVEKIKSALAGETPPPVSRFKETVPPEIDLDDVPF